MQMILRFADLLIFEGDAMCWRTLSKNENNGLSAA